MRTLKASLLYFALVFGVGVVLGTLRVLVVVPAVGTRWAELLEQPLMLAASYGLARVVLHRYGPFAVARRLAIGVLALLLMVAAELTLAVAMQGRSLLEYVTSRDAVAGTAYALSLAAFALMPLLAGCTRRAHAPGQAR